MGELSDYTLQEIRDMARAEASTRAYELLAKKLQNEHVQAVHAGNQALAAEFSEELRGLANEHFDLPVLLEIYVACLYNTHHRLTEPTDRDRVMTVLRQIRDIETSDRSTSVIVDRYATALNNTHLRSGKWGDSNLGRFTREELARLSEHPQASSQVIDFYSTSLSNSHLRRRIAGDPTGATALLETLRQLSARYPNNLLVLRRLAKALADEAKFAAEARDDLTVSRDLDELHAICGVPERAAVARESLALALCNAYINLHEAVQSDRAEALLADARTVCEQSSRPADRISFAKILRNKHYHLVKAGEFGLADAPMEEILALELEFPGEDAIVEQAAAVLQNGHVVARKSHRPDLAANYLADLRGFYRRHPVLPLAVEYFAQCLLNTHFEATQDPRYGFPDEHLAELQSVFLAHPFDAKVADYYANALYNSLTDPISEALRDRYLERLRQMSESSVANSKLVAVYAKGLRNVHVQAIKKSDEALALNMRQALRSVVDERGAPDEARGVYCRLLVSEIERALAQNAADSADMCLWEIRSLHSAYPESESIAGSLSQGLVRMLSDAVSKDEFFVHELLQELRDLDFRYPNGVHVARAFLYGLAIWQMLSKYKRLDDAFDSVLGEARSVYRRQKPDAPSGVVYTRILSEAAGAAWVRLRIADARSLTKEFNEVVAFCASDEKVSGSVIDTRWRIVKSAWGFFQNRILPPRALLMLFLGWLAGRLIIELFLKKH